MDIVCRHCGSPHIQDNPEQYANTDAIPPPLCGYDTLNWPHPRPTSTPSLGTVKVPQIREKECREWSCSSVSVMTSGRRA